MISIVATGQSHCPAKRKASSPEAMCTRIGITSENDMVSFVSRQEQDPGDKEYVTDAGSLCRSGKETSTDCKNTDGKCLMKRDDSYLYDDDYDAYFSAS